MRSSVKQLLNGGTQGFQISKPHKIGESEGGKKKWEVSVEDPNKGRGDDHSVLKDVKQHLNKEIEMAKDMVKKIPEKMKETKEEIKDLDDVAKEAAKRDLHKVAQKVGLARDD